LGWLWPSKRHLFSEESRTTRAEERSVLDIAAQQERTEMAEAHHYGQTGVWLGLDAGFSFPPPTGNESRA
jgi:hypothetical protein